MKINHKVKMDLIRSGIPPRIQAVQNDALCRSLALELLADDQPWSIPEDARAVMRYSKPDHTGGLYDTLPDGSRAWSAKSNRLYIELAPQMLTVAGTVELAVTLILGAAQLTTFIILVEVRRQPGFSGPSEDYNLVTAFLPQPTGRSQAGQFLRISKTDAQGHVLALEAVNLTGEEAFPEICSITNKMTHASTTNSLASVAYGSGYAAAITADEGYALVSVTVLMGGHDVTDQTYTNGHIWIDAVTGDILVTAVALEIADEQSFLADAQGILLKSMDGHYLVIAET